MKRLVLIFGLLLLTNLCFGQVFTLKGTVYKNGETLPGVSVSVKGTPKGTVTDSAGHYALRLPKGNYTLVFSFGNKKTLEVRLDKDKTLTVDMTGLATKLDEVFVSAIRADADSPITHSNLSHKEIEERNLGQDIPILMRYMPNVVTTSDAGAGIGYTGIRVRGSDASRTNVTINGVPLNDSESQGVFWVDLGDFTSSVQNLQLQRGVGTSTNGAGAFGASINVLTNDFVENPSAEITNTYGSFNTEKRQIRFNTGLIDDHFAFSGNVSLLKSDGYRDRAFSDLKSYFLQGVYHDKNTLVEALGFGGTEKTYQAYYGISAERLKADRTFNPAGMYSDSLGNVHFYRNQTDNYQQDHFQLLWNQKYNTEWSSNITAYYTYGRGYYENYHEDADLNEYGLPYFDHNGQTQKTSDLVNQKWLSNHFYGTVFGLTYDKNTFKAIIGGGWNRYLGDHYGTVVYTKFALNPNEPFSHYYDNHATKSDFNVYGKASLAITDKLAAFGDMQWRRISYEVAGPYEGEDFRVNDDFSFFNPKAGLTYQINRANQLYFSYARANREPSRGDYKSALLGNPGSAYPKAETLNDFELGWRLKKDRMKLSSNFYYMDYHNQLVLTGEIDPEGRFVRRNSGESYRLGLEINASIKIGKKFELRPNIAVSQNKNRHFVAMVNGSPKDFGNTTISFSPSIVAANMLRYSPTGALQINFLTKFVGEQYMGNTEADGSKLDSYLVNGLNVQYKLDKVPLFDEIVFTGLVNNIFDEKYVSNGYYSPDYGASYYPQAGINYLLGVTLKF